MCGICGIVSVSDLPSGTRKSLERMTDSLDHRGPDDKDTRILEGNSFGFAGFGHTRLSILDLTKAGRQPMTDETEKIWIVFNGEIYNHPSLRLELESLGYRFHSSSDTETILKGYTAWGTDIFSRIEGMFALAIYDTRDNPGKLFLARDHAGIKPLYFYFDVHRGLMVFGSELKAVIGSGLVEKKLDSESILHYLALGYIPTPNSIWEGVSKLEPGSWLEMNPSGVRKEYFWKYPSPGKGTEPDDTSEEFLAQRLRTLLRDSVQRHLLSDVPVGVLLSGGVDSTALAALVVETGHEAPMTFSVGFKGMGYYDERPYARLAAKRFGTDHREIEVEPDLSALMPILVEHFDEPFADSSAIPTYYISRFCREHVKVILSGTGADDIFGGYRRYSIQKLVSMVRHIPEPVRKILESVSKTLPVSRRSRILEFSLYWKRLLDAAREEDANTYANLMHVFDPADFGKLLSQGFRRQAFYDDPIVRYFHESGSRDYLSSILFVDYMTYLPDDLLVKEDRMTMAVGLEGRVPFLDRRVVEFAGELPPRLRVKGLRTKFILKKALTGLVPEEILNRPKHGFAVPIGEWFKGPLRPVIEKMIKKKVSGLFNYEYMKELLEEHSGGRQDHSGRLWTLLFFESWYEKNL